MAAIAPLPATTPATEDKGVDAPHLRLFVFALFFMFGGITSLNDVIIPKLKSLFTLSYGEAMLVQSAFFGAYFLFSLPAASVVQRLGYMRTATIALATMTAGCLLFVPAAASGVFGVFLFALFVLAAGITSLQVVANPLISLLGPARTASSRLTFAQAFNSLGTTIFPYVGSILILGALPQADTAQLSNAALHAFRAAQSEVVGHTYMGLAAVLAVIAVLVWLRRNQFPETPSAAGSIFGAFDLLNRPRFALGTVCIFLYVGAEVAIGSLIVSYLMQSNTLGLSPELAGKHVPFYWAGALVGRFVGAWILERVSPGKVLATVAVGAILLILLSANSVGAVSAYALLAIGLMNAIMFPTIFTLASAGLGDRTAEGSGVICIGIVGGAIIPPLTGHIADLTGLRFALLLPALCYCVIVAFGLYTRKPVA